MKNCKLSKDEQQRRKELATHVREMICEQMPVEAQDETSLMMGYRDYYLQISFSDLHPLMVFCLAKALIKPSTVKQQRMANDLNLRSILGSHAINEEVGCYSYPWWSYRFHAREKNAGWRIDYFLVSNRIANKILRAEILSEVQGSDHCPVLLELDL